MKYCADLSVHTRLNKYIQLICSSTYQNYFIYVFWGPKWVECLFYVFKPITYFKLMAVNLWIELIRSSVCADQAMSSGCQRSESAWSCILGLETVCSKLLFLQVVGCVDQVAKGSKHSLRKAAWTKFTAWVSGTFNRSIRVLLGFYHLSLELQTCQNLWIINHLTSASLTHYSKNAYSRCKNFPFLTKRVFIYHNSCCSED